MSRLFCEFYLDEDVSVLVANLLRSRGFSATTTLEAGNRGNSDARQLNFAVSRQKALLTHNRSDFEHLARQYFTAGELHYGIIIAVRRPPLELTQRLLPILNHRTADEMQNQLIYL